MLATSTRPTVLIVDDEPDVRDLARALLELDGFDVVGEAVNGAEGVQRYLALDPPPVPTVVLLDNRMPVRSGMEAARDILARYPTQLIVLFTAYASPELEQQARAVGVAAVVSKTRAGRLPKILRDLLEA